MKYKGILNNLHSMTVMNRRVHRLSVALSDMFESSGSVIDVGCGDGTVALSVQSFRPDLQFYGVDVFMRPNVAIPAKVYDGTNIPYEDNAFDYAMVVDVLHHTDDTAAVLSECLRVAKRGVIIKDHVLQGLAAEKTLRFMDWVGNRGHDVRLPYNYLTSDEWNRLFHDTNCKLAQRRSKLKLYPAPFSWLFDRQLHFVARVCK